MSVEIRPQETDPLDLDRLGQEFIDNPFPVLARLRERDRIPRVIYHTACRPGW